MRGVRARPTRRTHRAQGVIWTLFLALAPLAGCGRDVGGHSAASARTETTTADSVPVATPLSGTLTGLYIDTGAGALFTDCETSSQWRIRPGEAADEVRRSYLAVRSRRGDAARVTLVAHSTTSSEGGISELVVDSVLSVSKVNACPGHPADASLTGTTWRMTRLWDRDLTTLDGEVTLRLDGEARTLWALTLCESLSGTFRWIGTELRFGGFEIAEDRCAGSPEDEAAAVDAGVLDAFRTTGSYRIRGDTLELMGENGVLARLVAKGDT